MFSGRKDRSRIIIDYRFPHAVWSSWDIVYLHRQYDMISTVVGDTSESAVKSSALQPRSGHLGDSVCPAEFEFAGVRPADVNVLARDIECIKSGMALALPDEVLELVLGKLLLLELRWAVQTHEHSEE